MTPTIFENVDHPPFPKCGLASDADYKMLIQLIKQ